MNKTAQVSNSLLWIDLNGNKGGASLFINDQVFKINRLGGEYCESFNHNLIEVSGFLNKLFTEDLDLNEGKILNLSMEINSKNIISINYKQKDKTKFGYQHRSLRIHNEAIGSLFKNHNQNAPQNLALFHLNNITKTNISEKLMNIFTQFINFLYGTGTQKSALSKLSTKKRKVISKLSETVRASIYKRAKGITAEEIYITNYVNSRLNFSHEEKAKLLEEILKGAYVMIDDGGKTYGDWVNNCIQKHHRLSSHRASATQYAIRGSIVSECLFSKKIIKDSNGAEREVTWFQLERYPAKWAYHILHLWSWGIYKIAKKNQGPFGESIHQENSKPLILDLRPKSEKG